MASVEPICSVSSTRCDSACAATRHSCIGAIRFQSVAYQIVSAMQQLSVQGGVNSIWAMHGGWQGPPTRAFSRGTTHMRPRPSVQTDAASKWARHAGCTGAADTKQAAGTRLQPGREVHAVEAQQVLGNGHHAAAQEAERHHPEEHDLHHGVAAPRHPQQPLLLWHQALQTQAVARMAVRLSLYSDSTSLDAGVSAHAAPC
jgi:hypothetical protein